MASEIGNPGDAVKVENCHNGPSQRWKYNGPNIVGMNELCLDIFGGDGVEGHLGSL